MTIANTDRAKNEKIAEEWSVKAEKRADEDCWTKLCQEKSLLHILKIQTSQFRIREVTLRDSSWARDI